MSSEEDEELMMLLFLFLFTANLWWRRRIEIDIVVDLVLVYIKPLDLMKKTKNW